MRQSIRLAFIAALLLALALLTTLATAEGRVVNGHSILDKAPTAVQADLPSVGAQVAAYLRSERYQSDLAIIRAYDPPQLNGLVTFDSVAAPCNFVETTALRGVLEGATFFAPGLNGGGVLNECSNFGVPAFSAPNFLATNPASAYADGGTPRFPQLILVGGSSVVTLMAEGTIAGSALVGIGLGAGGVAGFGACPVSAGAWAACTIGSTGNPIAAVILFTSDPALIVDNIAY